MPRKPKRKPNICLSTVLLPALSKNVKRLRERADLSQGHLAARAGLGNSYVSMLEAGTRSATLETVEHLANALGVHPAALFLGSKRS